MTLVHSAEVLEKSELQAKIRRKTKLEIIGFVIVLFLFNWGISTEMELFFDDIFQTDVSIEIVAHRGGGDLEAENTVEGIERAIAEGAKWTEIDVQRTLDGKYIINHDATFSRIAAVSKKPMEMTLAEIKKLSVKNEFNPEMPTRSVPTLEEILDVSKGRIGVFVELKGKSADYQMVDDVVQLINEKNMLDECVILSLDYDIIQYTHKTHPNIATGYLYFFSIGGVEQLTADYLIMEENQATPQNIKAIHSVGKKAIVWTVNTKKSVDKFVISSVDGIITDHVLMVREGIEQAKNRSHLEIIIDALTK